MRILQHQGGRAAHVGLPEDTARVAHGRGVLLAVQEGAPALGTLTQTGGMMVGSCLMLTSRTCVWERSAKMAMSRASFGLPISWQCLRIFLGRDVCVQQAVQECAAAPNAAYYLEAYPVPMPFVCQGYKCMGTLLHCSFTWCQQLRTCWCRIKPSPGMSAARRWPQLLAYRAPMGAAGCDIPACDFHRPLSAQGIMCPSFRSRSSRW